MVCIITRGCCSVVRRMSGLTLLLYFAYAFFYIQSNFSTVGADEGLGCDVLTTSTISIVLIEWGVGGGNGSGGSGGQFSMGVRDR